MEAGAPVQSAVLVWITPDKDRVPEMLELCRSAGYDIIAEIGQRRSEPDPRLYAGPGKIDEIGQLDVEYIVTASDLTPSQVFGISHRTGKKVADRTRVILDLFRNNANSPEAKMQVEIADLRYQLPVLKEYIHQGTLTERPGFMAGGEYAITYYHDMVKRKMTALNRKLDGERRRRGHKRTLRKRRGLHQISIAGYTNAGKSSLLNALMVAGSDDKVAEVGGEMFTTIATTTRKMKGDRGCLISDTVGFIRDLPPWLVEGFMSTLEEVFEADIIVLVVDGSEPGDVIAAKLSDSLGILRKGGTEGKIVLAVNKIDLMDTMIPEEEWKETAFDPITASLVDMVDRIMFISASEGTGIGSLVEAIESMLPPLTKLTIRLPQGNSTKDLITSLRKHSSVIEEAYDLGSVRIVALMEERWAGHFMKRAFELGGETEIS